MASRTATAAKKTPAKTPAKKGPVKAGTPVRSDEWTTEIVESKVNEQVLSEELRARGLETRGATMTLAKRLEKHVCSNAGSVRVVKCEDCKGRSLATDKRCPFCGSADEVIIDEPAKKEPAPEATATPLPVSGTVEREELVKEQGGEEVEDADVLPVGTVPVMPVGEIVVDAEPVEPEAAPAGAIVPVRPVMSDEEALAASAGFQPSADEVSDLDRRVARVRELELNFRVTGWELGNELNQINSGKLFLARRLPSGAPKYRSFTAFVEAELGLDNSNARKFMAVAATYSRDQVLAHGMSKMLLVVQIPEGVRDRVLSDAEAMRLPSRGLKDVVARIRGGAEPEAAVQEVVAEREEKKGYTPAVVSTPTPEPEEDAEDTADESEEGEDAEPTAAPGPTPKPAAAPVQASPKKGKAAAASSEEDAGEEDEKPTLGEMFTMPKATPVEVITMPGRFQMKFYARPKAGALGKKRRAFTIQEQPRAVFKFQNGAELRLALHAGPSGLYATCEVSPPEG